MVTTREQIDGRARMFGWQANSGTYVRGDYCVQVDYSVAGHIINACRYRFFKLDDLHLEGRAGGRHKKTIVLSWLAQ
jgi:hypothetical protein